MSLLFDQNLSYRLCRLLQRDYAECVHVRELGLERATDGDIWAAAAARGLAVVSKDADFRQMSFLLGPPPKIVFAALGNASTDEIAAVLRDARAVVLDFLAHEDASFLVLD